MLSVEKWLNVRSGLGEISGALNAGSAKIAFLGNSVSAQKEGYRPCFEQNICQHFGHKFQFVNASLGGIGSLACSFLVDDFVSRHKPDICFVECTTADTGGATPLEYIGPAVEGIISQLIANDIKVCLIHLYRHTDEFSIKQKVIKLYEQVAIHYKVPSVNIHEAVAGIISEEKLKPEKIAYDGAHTTPDGATITAGLLFDAFVKLLQTNKPVKSAGIAPLYANLYRYTNILPAIPEMLLFPEAGLQNKFRILIPYLQIGQGNEITFIPQNCELVGIMVIADSGSGVVTVDSQGVISNIQLFDKWCEKERIQAIILDVPHQQGLPFKISLAGKSSGDRGANTTANTNIKKAESLKVIGFLLRYPGANYSKKRLW
jgi:hypothetical protein